MKQLFINDLQILCCSFRRTAAYKDSANIKKKKKKDLNHCCVRFRFGDFCIKIRTVSSRSSSCGRPVRSARGGAGCPAAPPGSASSPPRWAVERPPARPPGSGRRGTCPGSSAPGPLPETEGEHRNGTNTAARRDILDAAWLTVVEYALLQQRLPHAHSLYAGVDTGALLHLPVDQLGAHAALPVVVHRSIKVFSLQLIVCFMLVRNTPRALHSATSLQALQALEAKKKI